MSAENETIADIAAKPIPVKTKFTGANPWKVTIGYKKEGR